MSEVERCRTKRRILLTRRVCRIEGARCERSRECRMHRRGLPNGFGDGCNCVMLGAPLLVRIAGRVRGAREQARPGRRHRDDVVRRGRRRARGGCPQKRGHDDREKNQATHQPILACGRATVGAHWQASRCESDPPHQAWQDENGGGLRGLNSDGDDTGDDHDGRDASDCHYCPRRGPEARRPSVVAPRGQAPRYPFSGG